MLFDKFVNSILSIIKEESFRPSSSLVAVRQNVKQIPKEEIKDLSELKKRILRLLPLSVSMESANQDTESWSTRLFRGHKSMNPFSKLGDSKADGDKVYWAKYPQTALIYATNKSSWGTSGQQYVNIAQKAVENTSTGDEIQTKYSLGYISVAEPKNPESLKWYQNFGYEDEKNYRRGEREEFAKKNPNKLFNGISSIEYGFNKDQWKKRQQQQKDIIQKNLDDVQKGKINYVIDDKPNVLGNNPETVLSKYDVSKVRTYLIYNNSRMISLEKIKKYDPILYSVLLWDRI